MQSATRVSAVIGALCPFLAELVEDVLVVQHLVVERKPLVVEDVTELVALGAQVRLVVRVGLRA